MGDDEVKKVQEEPAPEADEERGGAVREIANFETMRAISPEFDVAISCLFKSLKLFAPPAHPFRTKVDGDEPKSAEEQPGDG